MAWWHHHIITHFAWRKNNTGPSLYSLMLCAKPKAKIPDMRFAECMRMWIENVFSFVPIWYVTSAFHICIRANGYQEPIHLQRLCSCLRSHSYPHSHLWNHHNILASRCFVVFSFAFVCHIPHVRLRLLLCVRIHSHYQCGCVTLIHQLNTEAVIWLL